MRPSAQSPCANALVSKTSTISAAVGTNVTGIVENSSTSALTVSGALTVNGGGTTLTNYAYTYDVADRVMTEQISGTVQNTLQSYTYDATNELTSDGTKAGAATL